MSSSNVKAADDDAAALLSTCHSQLGVLQANNQAGTPIGLSG
jgi:hypothetical protein